MLHRVLDQRLQNQAGHQRIARVVADLDLDLQLALEAYLHDLEISLEKGDLLRQHDLVLGSALECVAE